MKVFSSLLIIAPAFGGASAFLFPEPMKIRAGLADIADRQPDFNLKILLNIGQENDDTRLAIRGLELGLHKEKPEYEHVKMVRRNIMIDHKKFESYFDVVVLQTPCAGLLIFTSVSLLSRHLAWCRWTSSITFDRCTCPQYSQGR